MQAVISNGQATFRINPSHATVAVNTLEGLFTKNGAMFGKLLPGTYNATAFYHGDSTYAPTSADAQLVVTPSCPFTTVTLS